MWARYHLSKLSRDFFTDLDVSRSHYMTLVGVTSLACALHDRYCELVVLGVWCYGGGGVVCMCFSLSLSLCLPFGC